jgi:predicted metalloprotease
MPPRKIGDDALQSAGGGRVVPDSFTHGSSAQRQRWFSSAGWPVPAWAWRCCWR